MVNINDIDQKLSLEYPCSWSYKLIAEHKDHIKEALKETISSERIHTLKDSKSSKNGKYVSMNLELLVQNEDDRNFIYEALKAHQNIKMVL